MRLRQLSVFSVGILMGSTLLGVGSVRAAGGDNQDKHPKQQVIVPGEDRFAPLALTIHVGEVVKWINQDTDDHTVVSDDFFNTTGPMSFDQLLPGTDSTGGKPGIVSIRFQEPGTFVYYCRFHSMLDAAHQPVAPGPRHKR